MWDSVIYEQSRDISIDDNFMPTSKVQVARYVEKRINHIGQNSVMLP